MSAVVKKCPKDGIVYDEGFAGTCASCFGPLKFYCKTHNEWLAEASCPKCDGVPSPSPAPPKAPAPGPSIVGVLAVLAICAGVFVLCGWFLYRSVYLKPKPVTTSAPPPAPPTPPPARSPSPVTIVTLSLAQLLADADQHLGRLVKTTGTIQFRDAAKETFDLRQGDHILTVNYHDMSAPMKTAIAAASSTRPISVTGTWQRDDADNSYYIVAQTIDAP